MNVHRSIALVSASLLVGLLGVAQASNFAPPASRKVAKSAPVASLREKIRNANINGCG